MNRLYCFRRCPSLHNVTLLFTRNGRKASWLMSASKFWDDLAGIPMMSLIAPSRRLLSVELMPAAVDVASAGVANPDGGRRVALKLKVGVTLMPPGCPRWSL